MIKTNLGDVDIFDKLLDLKNFSLKNNILTLVDSKYINSVYNYDDIPNFIEELHCFTKTNFLNNFPSSLKKIKIIDFDYKWFSNYDNSDFDWATYDIDFVFEYEQHNYELIKTNFNKIPFGCKLVDKNDFEIQL